jgi:uncharacterized protein YraI
MRRRLLVHSLGALLLASLSLASAQDAYTSRPMNVRAGPNREYPLVAQLDAGAPLDVHGCLDDWSWCDVSFDDNRGWIYAGGVSFVYQGGRVPLYAYGPRLGLPVITFSLVTYWNNYYRGRPWYAQRDTWSHRPLPPHTRPHGRPLAGPAPAERGRPSGGYREPPRGAERGHPGPQERPNAGRAMPDERPSAGGRAMPNEHPSTGGHAMPNERPAGGAHPMPNGRPSGGGRSMPGGAEHGHTAPPTRGAPGKQHSRESRPPGHPPTGGN